jgi:hypothetical protein
MNNETVSYFMVNNQSSQDIDVYNKLIALSVYLGCMFISLIAMIVYSFYYTCKDFSVIDAIFFLIFSPCLVTGGIVSVIFFYTGRLLEIIFYYPLIFVEYIYQRIVKK